MNYFQNNATGKIPVFTKKMESKVETGISVVGSAITMTEDSVTNGSTITETIQMPYTGCAQNAVSKDIINSIVM